MRWTMTVKARNRESQKTSKRTAKTAVLKRGLKKARGMRKHSRREAALRIIASVAPGGVSSIYGAGESGPPQVR